MEDKFETTKHPKSESDAKFIDQALEDNFIFASLTNQERRMLIDAMELFELVRLAFVPMDSEKVQLLSERKLVDEETLRLCKQFQTDDTFRDKMVGTEPMYTPRQIEATKNTPPEHNQPWGTLPPPLSKFDMSKMNANLPS